MTDLLATEHQRAAARTLADTVITNLNALHPDHRGPVVVRLLDILTHLPTDPFRSLRGWLIKSGIVIATRNKPDFETMAQALQSATVLLANAPDDRTAALACAHVHDALKR